MDHQQSRESPKRNDKILGAERDNMPLMAHFLSCVHRTSQRRHHVILHLATYITALLDRSTRIPVIWTAQNSNVGGDGIDVFGEEVTVSASAWKHIAPVHLCEAKPSLQP